MEALALVAAVAGGILCAVLVARRTGRYLNFGTLLVVNLVLVAPVSGLVHLLHIGDASRGYFDLDSLRVADLRATALWACLIAVAATCLGCLRGAASAARRTGPGDGAPEERFWQRTPWLLGSEARLLLVTGSVLLAVGVVASARVHEFALAQEQSRIIAVDSGLARYAFMSNWLAWVISFGLLALAATAAFRKPSVLLAASGAGIVVIGSALAWSGGRSIVLVMVLPIVLTLLPLLRGARFVAVIAGVLALVAYTSAVTQARATAQTIETTSLASVLDWQWGRYSMLGFAADRVDATGYLWGETFVAGLNNVVTSLLGLVGLSGFDIGAQTITQTAATYFFLPQDQYYIVPGLLAELFVNFGLVGIAVGCYLLGRATMYVDRRFVAAASPITALAWAYVGTLLVLRTWNSDSGTIWVYLAFIGAPLMIVAGISARIRKRARVSERPAAPEPVRA